MAFADLRLRINPLFLLLLAFFAFLGLLQEAGIAFLLVLLHELSHSLLALRLGYKINKIELFPFGGVAEYKGLLEMEPWKEIKIALVGPLFNLCLAVFFIFSAYLGFNFKLIGVLIRYNLIIAVFNLLPALPLDGGRILRGLLVNKLGFKRGSLLAVKLAKKLAFIGGLLGVIILLLNKSNIWFLFLAFFVYGAAVQEEKQIIYRLLNYLTQRREFIRSIEIKPVLTQVVRGDMLLKDVIYYINPSQFNIFYVLNQNSQLSGVITESALLASFFKLSDKNMKIIDII